MSKRVQTDTTRRPFFRPNFQLFPLAVIAALASPSALAGAAEGDQDQLKQAAKHLTDVVVYGEKGKTDTATKLDLTVFETPQTVTAISRVQMDDFALDKVNDVLDYTPGVTVEEVETDRTYYTARGFDIVNFQYDGVGVPFTYGINLGQQDTAIYEKVEVVKGAAGLITGLANPSATINFVRKRPTDNLQMDARVSANEWQGYRLDGDVSGRLIGSVRGRLVVATEDSESYLDRHEIHSDVLYGVIEADLTEKTLLTVGHSYDSNQSDGVLWGALPLLYVDGTPTDYAVSTSNAPDWTFADTVQNQSFVELKQALGERWMLTAIYTRTHTDYSSELFYTYGDLQLDETGLTGSASGYTSDEDQSVYDIFISGDFGFAGRNHQLVVGYNLAEISNIEASFYDSVNGSPALGADWADGTTPRPHLVEHDSVNDSSDLTQTQKSLYVATRLNLSDRLSALVGARRAEVKQRGFSYGGRADTDAAKTVPYYGATFRITETLMAYGSYSEVFTQQTFVNDQFQPLGATAGDSAELGLKLGFNDQRGVLTLSTFKSTHSNLGEFVGRDETTGTAFYEAREFKSKGYELELSGEFLDGLNISAGITKLDLQDNDGAEVRPYVPDTLVKMSASYRIPSLPTLRVGGVIKWQDDITTADGRARQDDYALLDLALHYGVTSSLSLALNMENVTDEKYYNSLYWDQAFYGAPRNLQASLRWTY